MGKSLIIIHFPKPMLNKKNFVGLLRKDGFSKKELEERLKILNKLELNVLDLNKEIPEFKGIEIFGSFLNSYFNNSSDIDVNFLLMNNRIYNKKCDCHNIYYFHIIDRLSDKISFKINCYLELDKSMISELSNFDEYEMQRTSIPFGIFLGDEIYRKQIAKNIIQEIKEKGLFNQWSKVIHTFNISNRKDLTNPQEDYRLSSFEKLIKDYEI